MPKKPKFSAPAYGLQLTEDQLTFIVPAVIGNVSTTKDGGVSFKVNTNELTDSQKIVVMSFANKFGQLAFKENDFDEDDLPTGNVMKVKYDGKTPAEWLRGILFVYSQKVKMLPKEKFEEFYRQEIYRIGEAYKAKLPPSNV